MENDRTPVEEFARNPTQSSRQMTPNNFGRDFHHVMRNFGPFMEQSRNISLSSLLRPSSFPRTLLQSHEQPVNQFRQNHHRFLVSRHSPYNASTSMQNFQNINASVPNPDSSPSSFSNDDRSDVVVSIEQDSVHPLRIDSETSIPSNRSSPSDDSQHDVLRQSPELRAAISLIEKYMPFLLILLAKLIYDHKIGILVMFGLLITFINANSVIKREVGKQGKRTVSSLLAVIINLVTCIFFTYYVFDSERLYNCLFFMAPYQKHSPTLWDLLWVVGVTDSIIKLITIICKATVVALPSYVLAFQKRGKFYLFIEQTSQSFRAVIPIPPWLIYLLEAYEGVSRLVGIVLCAAYVVAKGNQLLRRFREWKLAFSKLVQSVTYGCVPNKEQVEQAGNLCPICQDNFRQPTMLLCKHIFCEECVSMWFDRERTCPMCRTQIADDPTWRDGATAFFLQVF